MRRKLTISADVVRLDVHALDLAALDHQSVALAPVGAEERRRGELDVQRAREGAAGVSKEADAAALVGVERLAPGGGPGVDMLALWHSCWTEEERHAHEGVVDGDDEYLAGGLDLGVLDVAGDMGVRAGRAWIIASADISLTPLLMPIGKRLGGQLKI
jgi:hypothetical protein